MLRTQVSEQVAQRAELARGLEDLEAKSGPLSADKAELAGRLQGLGARLKDAEAAKAGFEWRCRGLASEKAELADMARSLLSLSDSVSTPCIECRFPQKSSSSLPISRLQSHGREF